MFMPYYMMGGWGWGIEGFFLMLLFWIVLIALVVGLVRALRGGRHYRGWSQGWDQEGETKSALAILHERYAKGEIGKEEYEQKKKDIAGK